MPLAASRSPRASVLSVSEVVRSTLRAPAPGTAEAAADAGAADGGEERRLVHAPPAAGAEFFAASR